MPHSDDPILPLVARVVSTYVEHNGTQTQALPGLIRDVYHALADAGSPAGMEGGQNNPTAAAASRTVFDDHLICKDCGLHMKLLKRHLQTVHNTTPEEYRAKWRLPADYPMVAREYAVLRSSLAKESGLGTRPVPRSR